METCDTAEELLPHISQHVCLRKAGVQNHRDAENDSTNRLHGGCAIHVFDETIQFNSFLGLRRNVPARRVSATPCDLLRKEDHSW